MSRILPPASRRFRPAPPCAALSRAALSLAVSLALAAAAAPAAGQDGRADLLVQTGDAAPGGNGTFDTLGGGPVLNNSGLAAFDAFIGGATAGTEFGLFRAGGGAVATIVRVGDAAPGGGTFLDLLISNQDPAINDRNFNNAGQAAFFALTDTGTGVFLGGGATPEAIARDGEAAPGGGTFDFFSSQAINAGGRVAFQGVTDAGAGLYAGGGGGPLTALVAPGAAAPDGNGTFSFFSVAGLNDAGQVGFAGFLDGTAGGFDDDTGVFVAGSGGVVQVARGGQAAPGGGTYSFFGEPTVVLNGAGRVGFNTFDGAFVGDGVAPTVAVARNGDTTAAGDEFSGIGSLLDLNDAGTLAFTGFFFNRSGNGVFAGDGAGPLTQIAVTGDAAPDGDGTLLEADAFGGGGDEVGPAIAAGGQVAFGGFVTGTASGTDERAIFVGDGTDLLQVVREGGALAGGTVSSFSVGTGGDYFNDFGQVAYQAVLTDGSEVITRWTPDLHYRGGTTGSFETPDDFTFGLDPTRLQNGNAIYDVFLDADAGASVALGTGDVTLKSLTVGGGAGTVSLDFGAGSGALLVTEDLNLSANGALLAAAADLTVMGDLAAAGAVVVDGLTAIDVLGDVDLLTGAVLDLDPAFVAVAGQAYTFLRVGGVRTGLFSDSTGDVLNEGDFVGTSFNGVDLFLTYLGGDGDDIALDAAPVPEPGTWALAGLAACGGVLVRRRRAARA